jgi:Coenzyme PQQ synthesis protein D (PqqD)
VSRPPELTLDSVVVQAPEQLSSGLGGEAVLLDLREGVYYGLDSVGARIWELVQEPRSVADVRDTLLAEYEVEPERCEQDVVRLLTDLAEHGLVEVRP